jgi:hypothetical protein
MWLILRAFLLDTSAKRCRFEARTFKGILEGGREMRVSRNMEINRLHLFLILLTIVTITTFIFSSIARAAGAILVGNQTVYPTVDYNPAGQAEAFLGQPREPRARSPR